MTTSPSAEATQAIILENGQSITASDAEAMLAREAELNRRLAEVEAAQAAVQRNGQGAGLDDSQIEMLMNIMGMFGDGDNQVGDSISSQLGAFYQRGQDVSYTVVDGDLGLGTFLSLTKQDGGPLEIPDSLVEQLSRMATQMIVADPDVIDNFLPPDMDPDALSRLRAIQETLKTGSDAEKRQAETLIFQFLSQDAASPILPIAAGAMDQAREFLLESGLMEYVEMALDTVDQFANRAGLNLDIRSMIT